MSYIYMYLIIYVCSFFMKRKGLDVIFVYTYECIYIYIHMHIRSRAYTCAQNGLFKMIYLVGWLRISRWTVARTSEAESWPR